MQTGDQAEYVYGIGWRRRDARGWRNRGQAMMRLADKRGAIADFRKTPGLQPDLRSAQQSLRELGVTP